MSPLERLLAEELPTGAFGGPRDRTAEPRSTLAPARAAANYAALEAALTRRAPARPRLRLVPTTRKDAA